MSSFMKARIETDAAHTSVLNSYVSPNDTLSSSSNHLHLIQHLRICMFEDMYVCLTWHNKVGTPTLLRLGKFSTSQSCPCQHCMRR